MASNLKDVEALLFDVFGTVVNWLGSISDELKEKGKGAEAGEYHALLCTRLQTLCTDWVKFAKTWRQGYLTGT